MSHSPRRALVLGGTRYFGKRLVQHLLDRNYSVTLATRGQAKDEFGTRLQRAIVDRNNLLGLPKQGDWDVVFDQIAYCPNDAAIACEKLNGRVGRYVFTSTQSVYQNTGLQQEKDFDSSRYPIRMGRREDFDYGEGKRLAEAHFVQNAPFPLVAARIPIVLGPDDYTGRLEFHVDHVKASVPFAVPNLEAKTSFISSEEAARFLLWLVDDPKGSLQAGPINACSTGNPTMREILHWIEGAVGRKAIIAGPSPEVESTPFADADSRCLSNTHAAKLGFGFSQISDWLPKLISQSV